MYFQNFCTARKHMKSATKPIRHYPPHLRHVATLPWEIKNSNFLHIFSRYRRKCKQIAFTCTPILIRVCVLLCMLSVFMCFYQNLVLVSEYHVDLTSTAGTSAVTNFRCHKLNAKVKSKRTVTWKILSAISTGKPRYYKHR